MTMRRITETDKEILVKAYSELFKGVPDKEFREGCYRYADENDFYPPTPHKLAEYMPQKKKDKAAKEFREWYMCHTCGQMCYAMAEKGLCLDCAGFPPIEYDRKPGPPQYPVDEPYKIEGRMKCQKCGRVGICIKDPRDTGQWECRQCYSGLTTAETSQRFRDLVSVIDDKGHVKPLPEWMRKVVGEIR